MRHIKTLLIITAVMIFFVTSAQASVRKVELAGETYMPSVREHDGKIFYDLDDPEIKRLISSTASHLTLSSSGEIAIAYSPLRTVQIGAGEHDIIVNDDKRHTDGVMIKADGKVLIEPELLYFALALKADGSGGLLRPAVGMPRFDEDTDGRILRIPTCSTVRRQIEKIDGGLRIVFPGCAWESTITSFMCDDIKVSVSENDGVVMDFIFPANWHGEVRSAINATDALLACISDYHVNSISDLESVSYENKWLNIRANAPYRYSWSYDPESSHLIIDMPGVRALSNQCESAFYSDGPLVTLNISNAGSSAHPVLRFTGFLDEGAGFAFEDIEEEGRLAVRFDAAPGTEEASGDGATFGYMAAYATIVIDAGHGGGDPGCVSRYYGVYEKDVTLDVALRLRDRLEQEGMCVVMTRETDRDVSWRGSPDAVELTMRCDPANTGDVDCFISLHCNASTSSAPHGTSIHWYKDIDRVWAETFSNVFAPLGVKQHGLIRDNFYVLRNTEVPAVLVEMAFLTNAHDASLLIDEDFRERMAEKLAEAILRYFRNK